MLPITKRLAMGPVAALRPSRRRFLVGAAVAGAGLRIGFGLPSAAVAADAPPTPAISLQPFDTYLTIAPDNTVTVLAAHLEMGQGCYTGIATLVAEELDADWSQMRAEGAWGNPALYGNIAWGGNVQGTGGSTAMASSYQRYRKAGALARAMLVAAAAKEWDVPATSIKVEKGVLSHADAGKSATMGELADAAAGIAHDTLAAMQPASDVPLKDPRNFKLIGNPDLQRLDNVAKTKGSGVFTIDIRLPDMLTAMVAHPLRFGAKVKSFDASAAKAVKGVVDVVPIPRGVAVVAQSTWAAMKGREALKVEWDEGQAERRGSEALLAEYKKLLEKPEATVARNDGDAPGKLGSGKKLQAVFEFPYLAHAALEPMNAVVAKAGDMVEVWSAHQMPDLYQATTAEIAGLPLEKVKLHVTMAGGSFGRRATPDSDFIVDAVATAKAIGWKAPVKLQWTREDDMTGGRYRPAYAHKLEASLDDQGRITAWRHRIVGQSIMAGTPFGGFIQNGVDPTSVEGAINVPYDIPNMRVELETTEVGVPVLWWRAVGSTHTAYSSEVFMDELARAAGKDPIEFRLAMMANAPRHRAVLEKVRDASGWGTAPAQGRARGVAVAESFATYVAQVAEVSLEGDTVRVHKVICAVDCGVPINPDIIKAQMEGGIGFGLGAILKGALTLEDGRVVETNYDGYDVLRMEEMPEVEVHIMPSTELPSGVGEPGVPPIGPAVANAVAALTGKPVHVLPFTRADLTSA